jgi:hypothetical protein
MDSRKEAREFLVSRRAKIVGALTLAYERLELAAEPGIT